MTGGSGPGSATSPYQSTRRLPGGLAVFEGDGALLDGGDVPLGLLQQTAAAGGQVSLDVGPTEGEGVVVDEVEIAEGAGFHRAAIAQAVEAGGVVRLLLDDVGQRQRVAPAAVPGPVGEHEGRHGGIADGA